MTKNETKVKAGRLGGLARGHTKRREVNYAELARLSHQKRKQNREKSNA